MEKIKILHLITEPTRFSLIQLLFEHNYCVKALSKKLNISEPAVSQHMRVLKEYDVVQGVKIGYQVHYQVNRELIESILSDLSEQISKHPSNVEITDDSDCTCEFIESCIKRDSKLLKEQKNAK